ncbi:hypothetical protein COCC4DRAFT_130667 [Bipolaris maydis ATCC 48331]|uniref:Uncharacterized protein n=2 Tax=Cochliobolus heterostrophus TaxID=5016 RepID=M2UXZ8_COCH5|nr:uncharacterized protein COCC4DRAFT_130667 [Bipolaris maydis ATCC 48331]EMD92693.1 hypothetical protein COCHEDRAFT_64904 [Bipolaris maydis C5]KAJ5021067.1 hypothetical protein J3E73DRAFT_200402 [Bipolaris maydis]ENI08388.1 hypothetical protein COCC4DRAFT_130667 [Bipolaris maydis ATCC 48331]KAJ5061188.1 hypothetical protein J3E74DRAFT_214876 [Bipolaris maydis]KAJ6210458.1 hypothetical protein PSV09DRAFT_64904 [Bipolaris maydis]
MNALALHPTERTAECETVPMPNPRYIKCLVQVEAITLNLVNSLYIRYLLANLKRTIRSDLGCEVALLGKDTLASSNL